MHASPTISTNGFRSELIFFGWDAGCPEGKSEEFWTNAVAREQRGYQPEADIATVLTVIKRRSERNRNRDRADHWQLDFSGSVLESADLRWAHLERAIFIGSYLKKTTFFEAHLEGAHFHAAYLQGAFFRGANLEGSLFNSANLDGVLFEAANLSRAYLRWVNLEGADFQLAQFEGTHVEGADLSLSKGLIQAQIQAAIGDAETKLPDGLSRPVHWLKSPLSDVAYRPRTSRT